MPEKETPHRVVTGAISDGWVQGSSFLGSILTGWLLGWLLDRWLDTEPWFIVIGIIAGFVNGFYRMWIHASRTDDVRKK
jgi:F0F1-type ATP synthase assembly protein I